MWVARQRAASDSLSLVTSVPATAIDARDQVQQRGLAGPRGAHQAEELPFGHVERDVVQHGNRHAVPTIGLRHTANLDDRVGHTFLYCTVTLAPPRRRAPTLSTT